MKKQAEAGILVRSPFEDILSWLHLLKKPLLLSFLKKLIDLFILCIYTPEEAIRSRGIPVTAGCEPPCGLQELSSGHLEEQPVLLTDGSCLQN